LSAEERKAWRVDAHDVARLSAFVVGALMALLALSFLVDAWGDDARFAHRDFQPLWQAGVRAWAGESPYVRSTQPFVHPPVAIPLVMLLGLWPSRVAFVLASIGGAVAFAAALNLLARACSPSERDRATAIALAATAPSFYFALFLGQLSGLYVLCFAGCLAALATGAEVTAGALAGLLLIKPPLAIALAFAVIASRSRRAVGALALTALVLVLVSLAFGPEAWPTWAREAGWWAATLEDAPGTWWRQWTLYSFVRSSMAELELSQTAARGVSAGLTLPLAVAAAWVSARALTLDRAMRMRAASVLALATVALNAYLFYYDALLLVVPAVVAALLRETYAPRASLAVGVLACVSWALQLVTPLFGQGGVPLPGLIATMWLLVEVIDLARALRVAPAARR
jgi:hypothetical protein